MIRTALVACAALATAFLPRDALPAAAPTDAGEIYAAGRLAIDSGRVTAAREALEALGDHPLAPFLEYRILRRDLGRGGVGRVESFLARHADLVVAERLRTHWLHRLVRTGRWETFEQYYGGEPDDALRCPYLERREARGEATPDADLAALWLSGKSLDDACDPLLATWRGQDRITEDLVWARVERVLDRRDVPLARFLARRYARGTAREALLTLVRAQRDPRATLAAADRLADGVRREQILLRALRRIAVRQPEEAAGRWDAALSVANVSPATRARGWEIIGVQAALDHLPQATAWLDRAGQPSDPRAVEWRIRSALRDEDWATAQASINALPPSARAEPVWRYWEARALERTGDEEGARAIYRELAAERDYHGFLAADRLAVDYSMSHRPLMIAPELITRLERRAGIVAAKALHDAGDRIMARRQWRFTVARLDTEEIKGASVVAHRWGWHHDAIVTIARVKYWDDLDVRFPVVHERLVTDQARLNRIDSEWVYGVVRQESAFHARARSQVGALGLMQLMPGTARRVGRRLNLRVPSHRSILQVDNNIRLGTRYLRTVLDRAGGNPVVATAAYNAGPRKVEQWLPATGSLAADVWVESIPFNETRRFVKNVLAYTTVYQHRLGNHGPRLSSRMPTVSSRG